MTLNEIVFFGILVTNLYPYFWTQGFYSSFGLPKNDQLSRIQDVPKQTDMNQPLNILEIFGDDRQADSDQQSLTTAQEYNETKNICSRQSLKPNFKKPGRRVSEEKCLEFIWELKERENEQKKVEAGCADEPDFVYEIIMGRLAEPGEFPHMGALGWKAVDGGWIFKCGATLISDKFMVTAGHCTKSKKDRKLQNQVPEIVRIGARNLNTLERAPYPKDVKIKNIIRHPNYQPPKKYFDIALIELSYWLYFNNNVQPACLWTSYIINTDKKLSASGWGATEIGGKKTTAELRVGDLDLVDRDSCNQLLNKMCSRLWCGVEEHQMCAGKLDGSVDSCHGDSGGPLQAPISLPSPIEGKMYYILGVTSFGFGCARQNSPGVYTRISSFLDWIEPIVWPNETKS